MSVETNLNECSSAACLPRLKLLVNQNPSDKPKRLVGGRAIAARCDEFGEKRCPNQPKEDVHSGANDLGDGPLPLGGDYDMVRVASPAEPSTAGSVGVTQAGSHIAIYQ